MLFHLQFPFTDIRSFVPPPVPRNQAPSWPAPIVAEEFVRSFGIVRPRPRGGLAGWVAESSYCDTRRAFRFPNGALNPVKESTTPAERIGYRAVFRRLFFDGYAVGKTEIGLSPLTLPADPISMNDQIFRVLAIPVSIHTIEDQPAHCPLHMAGKSLSRLYAYATSRIVAAPDQSDLSSLVVGEAPMLFLEMTEQDANRMPLADLAQKLPLSEKCNFDLFFWRMSVQGHIVSVWCIVSKQCSSNGEVRDLRIYLLRLNAEHQALKRVLKAVASGVIAPNPRSQQANLLQAYLNEATRRIGKCGNKAQAYSTDIDMLAFSVFESAKPGERDAIMARLQLIDTRNNIIRKVETYASRETINLNFYGTVDMSNKTTIVNATDSIVNIESTLTNVSQTIGAMPVGSDADKKQLEDLVKQLTEALKKTPPDKGEAAEAVATQTSQLVEAAAAKKPNKTTLQIIAGGLKKGAEFLKEAVPSVITIAGQIISLIGKMHGLPI